MRATRAAEFPWTSSSPTDGVIRITDLPWHPDILVSGLHEAPDDMLLLAFISHLMPLRVQRADQAALPARAVVGHLGFTIIALVYVLIVMWQN
jgi:hypothetical protein